MHNIFSLWKLLKAILLLLKVALLFRDSKKLEILSLFPYKSEIDLVENVIQSLIFLNSINKSQTYFSKFHLTTICFPLDQPSLSKNCHSLLVFGVKNVLSFLTKNYNEWNEMKSMFSFRLNLHTVSKILWQRTPL